MRGHSMSNATRMPRCRIDQGPCIRRPVSEGRRSGSAAWPELRRDARQLTVASRDLAAVVDRPWAVQSEVRPTVVEARCMLDVGMRTAECVAGVEGAGEQGVDVLNGFGQAAAGGHGLRSVLVD